MESSKARLVTGSMCFDDDSEEDSSEGSGEVETFVSKTSSSSKVSTGDNTSSLPPKGGKENTKTAPTGDEDEDEFDFSDDLTDGANKSINVAAEADEATGDNDMPAPEDKEINKMHREISNDTLNHQNYTMMGGGDDSFDDEFGMSDDDDTTAMPPAPTVVETITREELQRRAKEEEKRLLEELKYASGGATTVELDTEPSVAESMRKEDALLELSRSYQIKQLHEQREKEAQQILAEKAPPKPVSMAEDEEEADGDSDEDEDLGFVFEEEMQQKKQKADEEAEAQKAQQRKDDVWENANRQFRKASVAAANAPKVQVPIFITFADAMKYFLGKGFLDKYSDKIVLEDFSCYNKMEQMMMGMKKLWPPKPSFMGAHMQLVEFFSIAKVPLLVESPTGKNFMPQEHDRMLQTIYNRLLQQEKRVPRSGAHFVEIGFQSSSPHTDLRGTGMLSLLQMISALETHGDFVRSVYKLSTREGHDFPFMTVCIRLSLICILAVRQGRLIVQINEVNDIFPVANSLFLAVMHSLATKWKSGSCTIVDFDPVIKRVEKEVSSLKGVKNLLKKFSDMTSA